MVPLTWSAMAETSHGSCQTTRYHRNGGGTSHRSLSDGRAFSEFLGPKRNIKERTSIICFLERAADIISTRSPGSGSMTLNVKDSTNGHQDSERLGCRERGKAASKRKRGEGKRGGGRLGRCRGLICEESCVLPSPICDLHQDSTWTGVCLETSAECSNQRGSRGGSDHCEMMENRCTPMVCADPNVTR